MSEGIGARLRGARERSRLTILQAAERLHTDPDILEALEADDFAALGAPVYVKGHLRHYAELVGESPEALFELYSQGTRVPLPDLTRVPKPVRDDVDRLAAPAGIVVVVIAAGGAVWWGLSPAHRQWLTAGSRPVPITVPAVTPVQSEQSVAPAPASGAAAPQGSAAVASAAVSPPSGRGEAAAGPPAHGEIGAVFTYSATSWTEVYDATGRRLLYGLSTGPAVRKLEGMPPLRVLLGDAGGVTIEVGGRQAAISPFVRADHTARFLIVADGQLLPVPQKNGG